VNGICDIGRRRLKVKVKFKEDTGSEWGKLKPGDVFRFMGEAFIRVSEYNKITAIKLSSGAPVDFTGSSKDGYVKVNGHFVEE
jgi:hypothetical protein